MPHKGSFNSQELETLDAAYHHALTKLLARHPERDRTTEEELRRKITQLASYGVVDPINLGDLALDLLAKPATRPTLRSKREPRRVA